MGVCTDSRRGVRGGLRRGGPVAALLLALWLSACGGGGAADPAPPPPPPPVAPYPAGLSDQALRVAGVERRFRIHVPPGTAAPRALVLVLHGGGGAGGGVADAGAHPLSVFRSVADREGFVAVYPVGLPAANGDPGWNDCRADQVVGSSADDIVFLAALIERLRAEYALPGSRVFVAGGSNGGLMAFALALQRADLVAAGATSGASLPAVPKPGACGGSPSRPVPMLMAHGTADPQMPYAGGCVANFGGACNRGRVIAAEATRDRWLQFNGLAGVVPVQAVVNPDGGDGGPANRFDHAGPAPVQWWRLDGAGHTVPSRAVPVPATADNGLQNRDIEFAEVAWAFFAARLP